MENQVLNNIRQRRSVRHFVPGKRVPREQLIELVKAGMAAPSACNRQPWAFIAIDDPEVAAELAAIHPHAAFLRDSSSAIAVCGDLDRALTEIPDYWLQDCSAATENILLAAEALGLGAVWCGVHPNSAIEPKIRAVLQLPERIIPLNLIVLGYPAGQEQPKDKFDPERLHWQRW